jgi:hypothetical protein
MGVREVGKVAPLGLVPMPRSPASAYLIVDSLLLPNGCRYLSNPYAQ